MQEPAATVNRIDALRRLSYGGVVVQYGLSVGNKIDPLFRLLKDGPGEQVGLVPAKDCEHQGEKRRSIEGESEHSCAG